MLIYYALKIVRYLPLTAMAAALFIFGLPMLGGGPMWPNFTKLTEPC